MLVAPPHWNSASEPLGQVGRGPSLLMLDYDGTLAPFQENRLEARPWPGIAERLDRLSTMPSVHLALVTGRSARELASLLPMHHSVEIWGSHGREHLTAEGVYTSANLAPAQQAALDQLQKALHEAGLGAQVERKPASLAAHWRGLDSTAARRVEQVVRDAYRATGERAGLQLLVFDGGVEVRSDSINKGHAALHMLTRFPTATAAYLGDDTTDEDAFAVLRGRGLTLLVRAEPRPSQATYWLQPPQDLLAFLDAWIRAAERAVG
ncbi:MAG TPA: trehalose-phosphatase [Acidobacteriaceae bacterium]